MSKAKQRNDDPQHTVVMRFLLWFKQLTCRHDFKCKGKKVTGATVDWLMLPARQYRFYYRCDRCGKEKSIGGQLVLGDRKMHPEAYNERGWPIDSNGNELPIASDA